MSELEKLRQQRDELNRYIAELEAAEKADLIQQVRDLMAKSGLSTQDIAGDTRQPKAAASTNIAAKYQNSATTGNRFVKVGCDLAPMPDDADDHVAVVDKWSGLMWATEALWTGFSSGLAATEYSPKGQHDLFGFSDWRVPTESELELIRFPGSEALQGSLFPRFIAGDSAAAGLVRAVRTFTPLPRFVKISQSLMPASPDAIDHIIVAEPARGLQWAVKGVSNSNGLAIGFEQAVAACNVLELGGHKDWRLPTVNELFGIVDHSKCEPSIDTNFFPGTDPGPYWTSTPRVDSSYDDVAYYLWCIAFDYGRTFFLDCHSCVTRDARAVRSIPLY